MRRQKLGQTVALLPLISIPMELHQAGMAVGDRSIHKSKCREQRVIVATRESAKLQLS
jgi:hypothetical protein